MAAGQMKVECGIADLGMSEQNLDGAQVGPGFKHVRREAVAAIPGECIFWASRHRSG